MEYEEKIQNSIKYIENNLCKNLKLIDIAQQSYFSKFYFHRLFRNVVGTAVMEYVKMRRLTEAAKDLAKTTEKITDIAFNYQYNSEESFSRAFKRVYGISPRKYRNLKNEILVIEDVMTLKKLPRHSSCKGTMFSMAA